MLPPLAEVDDLQTWIGQDISGTSASRAAAIIAAASTLVRAFTGRAWIDADGELDEGTDPVRFDAVQQVVVTVAHRVYTNPLGSTDEGTGPFSHSVAAWSALGLALRDEEKEMLGQTPAAGVPGLWSLRVEAPAEARGTWYSIDWWESELYEGDGS